MLLRNPHSHSSPLSHPLQCPVSGSEREKKKGDLLSANTPRLGFEKSLHRAPFPHSCLSSSSLDRYPVLVSLHISRARLPKRRLILPKAVLPTEYYSFFLGIIPYSSSSLPHSTGNVHPLAEPNSLMATAQPSGELRSLHLSPAPRH